MSLSAEFHSPHRAQAGFCFALVLACSLVVAVATSATADGTPKSGSLEIIVTDLESDEGFLVVALLNSAAQYDAGDVMFRSNAKVPIQNGTARITFEAIPFGSYAVKTFHDENANGELDTNFVGFPKEGFGFSNNAMGKFGPPSFEQASFELANESLRIEIKSN